MNIYWSWGHSYTSSISVPSCFLRVVALGLSLDTMDLARMIDLKNQVALKQQKSGSGSDAMDTVSEPRSQCSGAGQAAAATSAAYPKLTSTALVALGGGGSVTSGSSFTTVPSVSASGVPSSVDEYMCIRCEEPCSFADSTPYGRDLFKRICGRCNSSYRSKQSLIQKQKEASIKAGGNGKSNMEAEWKALKPDEQVAWYRQQKRNARHAPRDLAARFLVQDTMYSKVDKGRKRVHCLKNWDSFLKEGLMLHKKELDLAQQWRQLLLDPSVTREEHMVKGKPDIFLEFFDRIEKYVDESEGAVFVQKRQKKTSDAKSLQDALEEQAAEFDAARSGLEFHLSDSVPQVEATKSAVDTHEVPRYQQPIPEAPDLMVRPPTADKPAVLGMIRLFVFI